MSEVEAGTYVRVASLEQVRDGFVTMFKVAGKAVVLTRIGDDIHAFSGTCTHADFKLGTSRLVKGCDIECPVHGAMFDARSGAVRKGPADLPLPCYSVKIEGEDVLVEASWVENE